MRVWKYKDFFEELFVDKNIVSSSEITKLIKDRYSNCTDENARNIIRTARKNGTIERIENMVIGHNSFLYCRYGMHYTKNDIKNILCKDPKLSAIINIFEINKGVISYLDIYKLSGCLINKENEHNIFFEQIVNKLNYIYSCRKVSFEENLFIIDGNKYSENDTEWFVIARKLINQGKIECAMIKPVLYSLRRQNLVNDVPPLYRNEKNSLKGVSYNNLMFDAVAYSGVPAFAYDRNEKTILLFDMVLSQTYSMSNFKGFYDRIQIIKNSVKNQRRSVIPIIVSLDMDKEVSNVCKNMGILIYQLSDLFGNRIGEILKRYERIQFPNFKKNIEENITEITDLLSTIKETGQDDNLENLRGTLFEYFMHSVIYKWLGGHIAGELITGKKIIYNEEKKYSYEYDIIVPLKNEYLVIELKGYANSKYFRWGKRQENGDFEKETLGWFFRQTFPTAQNYYEKNPDDRIVKACFITTAHFDAEAKEKLVSLAKGKLKSQYMDIAYDGNQLKKKLKELNMSNEVKVLEQFYLNR